MYRTRGDKTGSVRVNAVAVKLAAQYQQFLDKNVKQYLIICLPGVGQVSELEQVTSNASSNMR